MKIITSFRRYTVVVNLHYSIFFYNLFVYINYCLYNILHGRTDTMLSFWTHKKSTCIEVVALNIWLSFSLLAHLFSLGTTNTAILSSMLVPDK